MSVDESFNLCLPSFRIGIFKPCLANTLDNSVDSAEKK